jgi:hypothetical protein
MKKRYVSVGGHNAENMSAHIDNYGRVHSFDAFDNGAQSKLGFGHGNPWRFYSPAHKIVRARRIALMAVFFVELQQDYAE